MADQERHISWEGFFGLRAIKPSYKDLLLQQLEKDLRHKFSAHDPTVVHSEMERLLAKAAETGDLQSVLYRVDLSEKTAVACFENADAIGELTLAILRREAQKVLFKIQYSR